MVIHQELSDLSCLHFLCELVASSAGAVDWRVHQAIHGARTGLARPSLVLSSSKVARMYTRHRSLRNAGISVGLPGWVYSVCFARDTSHMLARFVVVSARMSMMLYVWQLRYCGFYTPCVERAASGSIVFVFIHKKVAICCCQMA